MKCALIIAVIATLFVSSPRAADVRGCVTPKAKTLPNGNLDRQFVNIYFEPSSDSGVYLKIAAPLSVYVVEEKGPWLKVIGSPSSPFKEDEELGWVRKTDVDQIALRNCN